MIVIASLQIRTDEGLHSDTYAIAVPKDMGIADVLMENSKRLVSFNGNVKPFTVELILAVIDHPSIAHALMFFKLFDFESKTFWATPVRELSTNVMPIEQRYDGDSHFISTYAMNSFGGNAYFKSKNEAIAAFKENPNGADGVHFLRFDLYEMVGTSHQVFPEAKSKKTKS